MLTELQRKILERLREARLYRRNYKYGIAKNLAEYAGITLDELWKLDEHFAALGLVRVTSGGGSNAHFEITILGMHVIDPANPLYGGDGDIKDIPQRELTVLTALQKYWPGETPEPDVFTDTGLSKREFGDAFWELIQVGFAKKLAMGPEAEVTITKKGYALFQEHNPAFEDVRPKGGDRVNVYGNVNQSAVATGKATASVTVQTTNNNAGGTMAHNLSNLELEVLQYAFEKDQINKRVVTCRLPIDLKLNPDESKKVLSSLVSQKYLEGDLRSLGITREGIQLYKSIQANAAASPPNVNQTFNIETAGQVTGYQSGGAQTGNINAENVAVGDGAFITIDNRLFFEKVMEEIDKHPNATPEQKNEAKGLLAKIFEHPITSSAISTVLGALLA